MYNTFVENIKMSTSQTH